MLWIKNRKLHRSIPCSLPDNDWSPCDYSPTSSPSPSGGGPSARISCPSPSSDSRQTPTRSPALSLWPTPLHEQRSYTEPNCDRRERVIWLMLRRKKTFHLTLLRLYHFSRARGKEGNVRWSASLNAIQLTKKTNPRTGGWSVFRI